MTQVLSYRILRVGAHKESLLGGAAVQDRGRNRRRDFFDVGKAAGLGSVAEDAHRFAVQDLVHEDADGVAKLVCDVLPE